MDRDEQRIDGQRWTENRWIEMDREQMDRDGQGIDGQRWIENKWTDMGTEKMDRARAEANVRHPHGPALRRELCGTHPYRGISLIRKKSTS